MYYCFKMIQTSTLRYTRWARSVELCGTIPEQLTVDNYNKAEPVQ